ncbi:preprotein translocase subunit SecE [bacterium]|nr:preprotein translocase subunit SecE [bacterium]
MFKRIGKFLRETRVELSKVTWPTRREVISQTYVLIILCLVMGLIIGVMDFGIGKAVDFAFTIGR